MTGATIGYDAAYRHCRTIAAAHGRTYFLATRLLSPAQRPAVHALYAFARTVDDIVDHGTKGSARQEVGARQEDSARPEDSARQLDRIETRLRARLAQPVRDRAPASGAGLVGREVTTGHPHRSTRPAGASVATMLDDRHPGSGAPDADPPEWEPVLSAVADTITRFSVAPEHFWTFLDAMRMDVPGTPAFRTRYATMAELRDYMRGSAAAIGLQLLPVLGTVVPAAEAEPAAAALGEAFQLTNFIRDVGEDLDRGRIYLPSAELAAFGVDDDLLAHGRRTGRTDPRLRRALAHLIATNRALYRRAEPGIELLRPRVRPAIRTAAVLYAGILDEVERSDYAIFTRRATVPLARRLRVATAEFATGTPHPRMGIAKR
ncbi:phytoene/squalene synthase family protein [Nocardia sp. BMG51109]|uniref:phytoene/squalene synthase family protein n=1 Tax=Nocardia sp. BMG51109 TaxID=1056816 RepID=UPI000465E7B0|nr:phytoene/squalene synthase family protein [Nocardia sp. BMG51109]